MAKTAIYAAKNSRLPNNLTILDRISTKIVRQEELLHYLGAWPRENLLVIPL